MSTIGDDGHLFGRHLLFVPEARRILLHDLQKCGEVERFSKHRNLERARRLVYAGRGQDDDGERRELRPGLELVQERQSVHDRHHQVEQDQRRPWTSFQTFERGAPVGGFLDAVAVFLEALEFP